MEQYLKETYFLNYSDKAIQAAIAANSSADATDLENAVSLYYWVRDQIYYNPYDVSFDPADYRASAILSAGHGWCVTKAVLYGAMLRGAGIPARLGYADVKNHLTSKRLSETMGTDIFYYHGYTDVWLNNRWVKATPAFNLELCEKGGLLPLEFDGTQDSIFHPYSGDGSRHMEYLHSHGSFDDLPLQQIVEEFTLRYPALLDKALPRGGDFLAEVQRAD